jgi:hypothetical protein
MESQLKHRWSIGHNYLAGITAGDWWRLLRQNRFAVSPTYWHRAAFITLTSLVNSWNWRKERRRYGNAIDNAQIRKPPLFILGHWRSGTTLLHNLFAQDTSQFSFANTYQVVNPRTFLTTEEVITRRFAWLVPPTRPMDNMTLSFQSPQEDEFAPLLMTLCSPYLGISFPNRFDHYSQYLTFRDAPKAETEHWKEAFVWFCKKLSLNKQTALLLKSPAHTARIPLLLEMFPEARFVHIHRNPYSVFQSQRHFFDTAIWYTYLQKPSLATIDDGILSRYRTMYDAFFEDVKLIPEENYCEIRFDELERDPVNVMQGIYDQLSLTGFDVFHPTLASYVKSLTGYQKNHYQPLDEKSRQRVAETWTRNFQEWGYPI